MIVKRRKGNGPTMHTFMPYEFDCLYYNAFGYCFLRKKQCNYAGPLNDCPELNKEVTSKIPQCKSIEPTPNNVLLTLMFLNTNCRIAELSNKSEMSARFDYDAAKKSYFINFNELKLKKYINDEDVSCLQMGKNRVSKSNNYKIYATPYSFNNRFNNNSLSIGKPVIHKNIGKGTIIKLFKDGFRVKFLSGNEMDFYYDKYNDEYFKIQ